MIAAVAQCWQGMAHCSDLLRRAEEHLLTNRRPGKRKHRGHQHDTLTRNDLSAAKEVLPTWSQGAQAHSDPLLEPPSTPSEEDWDRPCAGLHYAALTALGSSGTPAEHIRDLLDVPRRVHANKIHAALSAVTVMWRVNGSMVNILWDRSAEEELAQYKRPLHSRWKEKIASPISKIDDVVKHVYREHNQEAIDAQGQRKIVHDRCDPS